MSTVADLRLRRFCAALLVVVLAVSLVPIAPPVASAAGPATYWVDEVAGSDSDPGTEAEPFATITHALSVAVAGDTVMIEPGVYEAPAETFPLYSFGVSLKSTEGTTTTVIDGGGTSKRLLLAEGPMTGLEITGLTFRDSGTVDSGAAVMIHSNMGTTATASPRIAGNHFEANSCYYPGGALNLFASGTLAFRPLIEDNVFVGNRSEMQGGAIDLSTLTNAVIRGNTFQDNQSGNAAAAIRAHASTGCTVIIEDNDFRSNTAAGYGGAIGCTPASGGTVRVVGNRFFDNLAWRGGALLLGGSGGVEITSNDAGGNDAEQGGGFAWLSSSEVTSTNNAVGGSAAPSGGAAWHIDGGRFRGRHDTIVGSLDATCAVLAQPGADAEYVNAILWNEGMADVAGFDAVRYSDVRDAAVGTKNVSAGPGIISKDPLWLDEAAHLPDIGPGSPCIDAGTNSAGVTDDFYGVARPVDGDGDGAATVDMGCCERTGKRTTMTLAAPAECGYAATVRVSGVLKDYPSTPVTNAPVAIQYSYNNFATVAGSKAATTTASGSFSVTFAPTKKTWYRAVYAGDTARLGSKVTRTVLPRVSLPKPSLRSPQVLGRSYLLRGTLKPRHTPGTRIAIKAYRYSRGKYRYQKTYYAKIYDYGGYSKYSARIRLPRTGRWRLRAYHPADSMNAKTYSSYRYVRVY